MVVFLLAFLVILGLTARFLAVGIAPFDQAAGELFPLELFDTVLVLSFLVWPVVAFLGAKLKKQGLVWTGTVAYLFVSSIYVFIIGPSPLGVQHMLFGGPFMLVGALWHSSRS